MSKNKSGNACYDRLEEARNTAIIVRNSLQVAEDSLTALYRKEKDSGIDDSDSAVNLLWTMCEKLNDIRADYSDYMKSCCYDYLSYQCSRKESARIRKTDEEIVGNA